jgi:hypothetical protein
MPSGKDWFYFIFVILGFTFIIVGIFVFIQIAHIYEDWPSNRCNPINFALADNISDNFNSCIQDTVNSYMGYLLQPLTFITNSLGNMLGGFMDEINYARAMFDKIRTMFSDITQSIFGVFLNLVIEFQRITIGIRDLIGKLMGIMLTLMYTMEGSITTMNSTWKGPPGQLVRALGKCFYPDTNVRLKNGNIKHIRDIDLGDVLEDGSIVESVMKIDNKLEPVPLYKIRGQGVNSEDIYVTGSHLVFDSSINKFIKVENYAKAELSTLKTDWFSCLITSEHKIHIGNEIFWDWEDHFIKIKLI